MNELALFSGAGGGILGGHLLGWRTVCAVEREPYAASVLLARQNDGVLPPFPVWDDVCTFDGRPWRGIVDVVSGGFPCQDISAAGKGAGIDGARSGLWSEMARIVGEVRPRYVFVENSPALVTRGLGRVLSDLAALGYDCRWTVLGAADVGAPHKRERIWIVADAFSKRSAVGATGQAWRALHNQHGVSSQDEPGRQQLQSRPSSGGADVSHPDGDGCKQLVKQHHVGAIGARKASPAFSSTSSWWDFEPSVGRVANGVAARMDRLKAIGNGQVPRVAATAWRILTS